MKMLKDLIFNNLPAKEQNVIVELIAVIGDWKKLGKPTLAEELRCLICGGSDYFAPYVDPVKDTRRVWMCADVNCESMSLKNAKSGVDVAPPYPIGVPWPLYCERNGIGDVYHNVRFEDIKQSKEKIAYMLKFLEKPQGIILMQGNPGTGKTYAAMGMCQFFLRKDTSCHFCTQQQMLDKWLEIKVNGLISNYIEKIRTVKLLVIDDFGTGDISPAFMKFFFDLINTRLQWTERGTVITTNLDNEKMSDFCGEALIDRILTGQIFKFNNTTSRRTKPI